MVIIPRWIRDEHVLRTKIPRTEYRGEMVCACSRDGLDTCYIVLRGYCRTEEEVSGFDEELGVAGYGEVFVVDLLVVEGLFGLDWSENEIGGYCCEAIRLGLILPVLCWVGPMAGNCCLGRRLVLG